MNIIVRKALYSLTKNDKITLVKHSTVRAIDLYKNKIITINFYKNNIPYLYIYKHPTQKYVKQILSIDDYNINYTNEPNISINYNTISSNAFKQEQQAIEKFINNN